MEFHVKCIGKNSAELILGEYYDILLEKRPINELGDDLMVTIHGATYVTNYNAFLQYFEF